MRVFAVEASWCTRRAHWTSQLTHLNCEILAPPSTPSLQLVLLILQADSNHGHTGHAIANGGQRGNAHYSETDRPTDTAGLTININILVVVIPLVMLSLMTILALIAHFM